MKKKRKKDDGSVWDLMFTAGFRVQDLRFSV